MKVLFTNYHISVNGPLVDDLLAVGHEVILPDASTFARGRIDFFADNREHAGKRGARVVSHAEWLTMEPMAILIPCMQHIPDFNRLYEERGRRDVLVYLTANSNAVDTYPLDGADFVLTHDLYYHRASKAPYKVWYFNQPTFSLPPKSDDDIRRTYGERKVNLYINNFDQAGFEPEYEAAQRFRDAYQSATGWRVPFYGYGMPDGWPQPPLTHAHMRDSMFTLCFKRRETWGQMMNESMQLGTPGIFLRAFLWSTFTEYLITPDVAIVDDTVEQLVARIVDMTFPEYETLVREAQWHSRMYCNDAIRREKVRWLFGKVQERLSS